MVSPRPSVISAEMKWLLIHPLNPTSHSFWFRVCHISSKQSSFFKNVSCFTFTIEGWYNPFTIRLQFTTLSFLHILERFLEASQRERPGSFRCQGSSAGDQQAIGNHQNIGAYWSCVWPYTGWFARTSYIQLYSVWKGGLGIVGSHIAFIHYVTLRHWV